MVVKHWQKINQGDTACIVAPAYGEAKTADVDAAIIKASNIVESYGLKAFMYPNAVIPGNHTLFDETHLRFSNSKEIAVNQLMDAFNDPACHLVWSYKGGYGAIRLLNDLAKEPEPQTVKPFIGFSDITIIHSFINNVWGWPSIHFGMPGSFQNVMQREDTKQSLENIIFGSQTKVSFTLKALNDASFNSSTVYGITVGGNMYNFEKLLGTKFSPSLDNRIIVIEEVDEPARKIDGFLQKLQLMQDFEKISAIIFATFTPTKNQELFDRVFKDFAQNSDIPTFQLDPSNTIGHGDVNNAFPLGTGAIISLSGENFQLNIESGMAQESELCSLL